MKDIINSFKASLYERTSSPLIGAFIFYWLVCNYKMIVVLFDDKIDSSKKFLSINDLYMNDFFHGIPLNGLIYPLIVTLIYILIFPWISNFIFGIWIYHQNNLKTIGNKKVLTYKEYGDLQRRFTELELSFDETFSKKDNEIIQLKKLIDDKETFTLDMQKRLNEFEKKQILYNQRKAEIDELKLNLNKCNAQLNENKVIKDKLDEEINSLKDSFTEFDKISYQNKELMNELTEAKREIVKLKEPLNKKLSEETNDINNILIFIASREKTSSLNLTNKFKELENVKLKYYINHLLEKGFITQNSIDKTYSIHTYGTNYLHENNII
ncbi:hypothetical protein LXN10_07115 [Arcobacter sp. KX21116]|uniref:coiled-coil domain-containing protein n=1 Tax=Arcobacter iocasae TaxID=2906515 RepID=UPI0035D487BF